MKHKSLTVFTTPTPSWRNKLQLFIISFEILFLELSLIRFIPAYIRYLGYFSNVILLGSFLGIGLGFLLARKRQDFFIAVPILLLALLLLIRFFTFEVQITTNQALYFTSNSGDVQVESFIILPAVFTLIAVLFAALAQKLGRLFENISPLSAYTIDIFGSITGIGTFGLMSYFSLPPTVWFICFGIIYILLVRKVRFIFISAVSFACILFFLPMLDDLAVVWSPYQKVAPYSVSNPRREADKPDDHWRLYVNNISHQEMTTYANTAPFYRLHYAVFGNAPFKKTLIIGSGSGQDVNVALHNSVEDIDAVEIDPVIANFGRQLHPDRPYSDSRVRLYINDARSYLENTDTLYDLIVYALPDSTILTTSLSSLRLESYLFTIEAFAEVKKNLAPNGLFVLYNYYRSSWLIDKIAGMLEVSFGDSPYIAKYEDNLAIFMIGPKLAELPPNTPFQKWTATTRYKPATDDWPFLYLISDVFPRIYLKSLLAIFVIGGGLLWWVTRGQAFKKTSGNFFFLGAAFLLIETKSIINFNLLFGATWMVNALVFVGILTSVLLAIWVNRIWDIRRIWIWVAILVFALFANYAVPLKTFLLPNAGIRYSVATVFFFSPIFLANVIFSQLFKRSGSPADNLGYNLLGAFFGGLVEYTAMIWGYHNLILVAILFYAAAFYFIKNRSAII